MKILLQFAASVSVFKLVIVSSLVLMLLPVQPLFAVVPGNNELVSRDSSGIQGNNISTIGIISADGKYVLFQSAANNLVPGDTNSREDVFLRDLINGTTIRASLLEDGTQRTSNSESQDLSEDGRYALYISDFPNTRQLFLYDRVNDTRTLVSSNSAGVAANWTINSGNVSNDGRYVFFSTQASNLIPTVTTTEFTHVYVKDLLLNTISLVDQSDSGVPSNDHSVAASISCNGEFLVMQSRGTNLTPNDNNGYQDVFLVDRTGGGHHITNITAGANDESYPGNMSCNGRYVPILSMATNLPGTVTSNNIFHQYAYDRQNGSLELVNQSTNGDIGNAHSGNAAASDDGYVFFMSSANNLVSTIVSDYQAYGRNLNTNVTELISINSTGQIANARVAGSAYITKDAKKVAYNTEATNLVSNDTNNKEDVFISETGLTDDIFPPVVIGALDRPANTYGWYNANVNIDWTATDPAPSSGTPTDPANTLASTEGANVTYTSGQSCDPDNNCATGSLALSIDKTAPTITAALAPAPNSNGWNNTDVTVTFTCSDALSGVDTCSAPVTLTNEGNGQIVSGTVVDKAGNSASVTSTVRIDKNIPTVGAISFDTSANQGVKGLNQTITVSAPANDVLSGINGGEYFVDTDPGLGNGTPMAVSGSDIAGTIGTNLTPGSHQIYVRSLDVAGNWSIVSSRQLIVLPF